MSRTGGAFRDNVEAFAVAIAMALVIRHFCIEAFRIPTGSMMPTLLGERSTDPFEIYSGKVKKLPGDRILVDKIVWLRREPRRFEVAVFQYPLNRNKNFIKRIAGMPNEWLRIVDGDIWTSRDKGKTWAIQRKPAGVRDQLSFAYWPKPISNPAAFEGVKCWEAGDGWKVCEGEARFEVVAGDAPTAVEFTRKVMAYDSIDDLDYAREPYVGDVRVSFEVERRAGGGELTVHLIKHGVSYRLVLGDKSYVEFGETKTRKDVHYKLASDEISFALSDGLMVVSVDGDVTELELPERTQPPEEDLFEGKWRHHAIRIEARDCKLVLSDVRIAREVHYTGDSDRVWEIPDGHYFMLGDNTQSSKDSRRWLIAEAHHNNGEVIRWEASPNDGTRNPPGGESFGGPDAAVYIEADIDGHTRRFQNKDIARWVGSRSWPFVSRDHLIGRAFSVFWPIFSPPIESGPTRVKIIR